MPVAIFVCRALIIFINICNDKFIIGKEVDNEFIFTFAPIEPLDDLEDNGYVFFPLLASSRE